MVKGAEWESFTTRNFGCKIQTPPVLKVATDGVHIEG